MNIKRLLGLDISEENIETRLEEDVKNHVYLADSENHICICVDGTVVQSYDAPSELLENLHRLRNNYILAHGKEMRRGL